jgi:hypothetical protein
VVEAVDFTQQDTQQAPAGLVHVALIPGGGQAVQLVQEEDGTAKGLTRLEDLSRCVVCV